MKPISLLTTTLFAVACGSNEGQPISDKNAAANAAYRTQQTGESLEGRQGRGLLPAQFEPTQASTEYTIDGQEGTAHVAIEADVSGAEVSAKYVVRYENYSSDGVNFIDGQIEYLDQVSTGAAVSVRHQVKGNATVWGEQSAELVLDVSLAVDVDGASVSVRFDGTVTADGAQFTYDDEAIDVSAGTF